MLTAVLISCKTAIAIAILGHDEVERGMVAQRASAHRNF